MREQRLLRQSICKTTKNKDVEKHLGENLQEMQVLIYKISEFLDDLASSGVSFSSFKKRQRKIEASVKRLNHLPQDFFEHAMLAEAKTILPSAKLLSAESFKIIDDIEIVTGDVRLSQCNLMQQMGRVAKRLWKFLIENNYAENKNVEKLAEILGSAKAPPRTLDFAGFRKDSSLNATSLYELVFSVPEDTPLKSSLQKTLLESVSSRP